MPYIGSKITLNLSNEQKEQLKSQLGQIIKTIPGKSENFLMVGFEDNYDLYFQGKKMEASAFVEVKLFGKAPEVKLDLVTAQICDLYEKELGISPLHTYVKYECVEHWGWNGHNF